MSTLVCTLEMLSWEGYSAEEQKQLSALYMPYLGLGKEHCLTHDISSSDSASNLDGYRHVPASAVQPAVEKQNPVIVRDQVSSLFSVCRTATEVVMCCTF